VLGDAGPFFARVGAVASLKETNSTASFEFIAFLSAVQSAFLSRRAARRSLIMVTAPVRCNGAGRIHKNLYDILRRTWLHANGVIVIDKMGRSLQAVRRYITRAHNFA
jgi:hypothetical protein